MDSIHWQVPGNANPFDTDLKDWMKSKMSQRSIGVLEFIENRKRITKSDFEKEIWDYLANRFNHIRNNSNIAHFYRPLEFAGLIIRDKENILHLSIDGRNFLNKIKIGDYDRAKDIYILQLLKVKYPNTATENVDLHLYPFRIIFKLLLDYDKGINRKFFSNEINYISKENDLYELFEEHSDAYLTGLEKGGNIKWDSWVISYLVKWNILSMDKNGTITISEAKYDFIKNLMSNYNYSDMFYNSEEDERRKRYKSQQALGFKRDISLVKKTIEESNGKCFLNQNHNTFPTSKYNNFVEVHHIIPISMQDSYIKNLDNENNLICLCPNCHRAIHLSKYDYKKDLLKKIYNDKKQLKIYIDDFRFEDLLEIYC